LFSIFEDCLYIDLEDARLRDLIERRKAMAKKSKKKVRPRMEKYIGLKASQLNAKMKKMGIWPND